MNTIVPLEVRTYGLACEEMQCKDDQNEPFQSLTGYFARFLTILEREPQASSENERHHHGQSNRCEESTWLVLSRW